MLPGLAPVARMGFCGYNMLSPVDRRLCSGRRNLRRVRSLSFVTLRDGEDPEQLLKRFQTQMQRSGILRELRNRRFFRSKGEQERLDKARSLRRLRRRRNR